MTDSNEKKATFKIFRAVEAPGLMESGCMSIEPMTELQRAGIKKAVEAGYLEGDEIKILTNMPGFSLAYAWFKNDYPLARHSHDSDCMYYVIAGSLQLGTESLGPRDCFFVPANVAYTYRPGPDGVEVLEIRHNPSFNFMNLSGNESFWNRAADTCTSNLEGWRSAVRPSEK